MNINSLESNATIFKDFFSHLEKKPLDIDEDTINKMDEDFKTFYPENFSPVLNVPQFSLSSSYFEKNEISFYLAITHNNCSKAFPHEWKYKKILNKEKIDQEKFKEYLELNPEYAQIHKKYAERAGICSTGESFQEICNKTINEMTHNTYNTNIDILFQKHVQKNEFYFKSVEIYKKFPEICKKFPEIDKKLSEFDKKIINELPPDTYDGIHIDSLNNPRTNLLYDLFKHSFSKIIVKIAELEALTSFIQKQEKGDKKIYHYNIAFQAKAISWNQLNDLFLLINKSANEFFVLCDAKILRNLQEISPNIGLEIGCKSVFFNYWEGEENQNPQKPVFPENVFFINDPLNKSQKVLEEIQFPLYFSKKNYNELRQRKLRVVSKGYIASKLDRVWLHESRYPYPLGTPKTALLHRVIINSIYGGGEEMQVCCGGIHGITPETLFLVFSPKTLKLTAIAEVKELDYYHSRIRIKWGKLEENEDPYLYVHHQRKFSNITEENKNQDFFLNCVQKKWNDFIDQMTNRAEKGEKELKEVILVRQKEDKEMTLKEIFAQKTLRKIKYVPNMEIPVGLDDVIFFKCREDSDKYTRKQPAAAIGEWPYCGKLPFIRNISHGIREVVNDLDDDAVEIEDNEFMLTEQNIEGYYDFFQIAEIRNLEFSKLTVVFGYSMKDILNTGCGCSDDKQILFNFHASELHGDGLDSTTDKINRHRCAISTVHFVPSKNELKEDKKTAVVPVENQLKEDKKTAVIPFQNELKENKKTALVSENQLKEDKKTTAVPVENQLKEDKKTTVVPFQNELKENKKTALVLENQLKENKKTALVPFQNELKENKKTAVVPENQLKENKKTAVVPENQMMQNFLNYYSSLVPFENELKEDKKTAVVSENQLMQNFLNCYSCILEIIEEFKLDNKWKEIITVTEFILQKIMNTKISEVILKNDLNFYLDFLKKIKTNNFKNYDLKKICVEKIIDTKKNKVVDLCVLKLFKINLEMRLNLVEKELKESKEDSTSLLFIPENQLKENKKTAVVPENQMMQNFLNYYSSILEIIEEFKLDNKWEEIITVTEFILQKIMNTKISEVILKNDLNFYLDFLKKIKDNNFKKFDLKEVCLEKMWDTQKNKVVDLCVLKLFKINLEAQMNKEMEEEGLCEKIEIRKKIEHVLNLYLDLLGTIEELKSNNQWKEIVTLTEFTLEKILNTNISEIIPKYDLEYYLTMFKKIKLKLNNNSENLANIKENIFFDIINIKKIKTRVVDLYVLKLFQISLEMRLNLVEKEVKESEEESGILLSLIKTYADIKKKKRRSK